MKRRILLPILIITLICSYAYGQTGQLDPTYGTGGKFSYPADTVSLGEFVLRSDGKMIAAGMKGHNSPLGYQSDFFTMCFLADGGIDSSYGINGTSPFLVVPGSKQLFNIAVQQDNKILLVGGTTYLSKESFLIARYNADGSVDSAFGDDGYKIIPITVGSSDFAYCVNVLNNGKILITGRAGLSPARPAVVKLNADGSYDSSFGAGGISVVASLGYGAYAYDTKIQDDGKIVMSLLITQGSPIPFQALRLNVDGSLDTGFGTAGVASVNFAQHAYTYKLEIQEDGKILLGGSMLNPGSLSQHQITMARLNGNGTLDNTFGTGGRVNTSIGVETLGPAGFLLQPVDQKILYATSVKLSNNGRILYLLARYLPNGALDMEWNGTGYRVDTFEADRDHFARNVFYTDAGRILYAGYSAKSSTLQRSINIARLESCQMFITTNPADISGEEGSSASFTVAGSSASAVYQWQLEEAGNWENLNNGGQYSGVNTATLTINNLTSNNNNERYRAVGIAGACTDTSAAAVLTVTPSTSVKELNKLEEYKLYPNPVADRLTIDGTQSKTSLASIEVFDVLGKSVLKLHLSSRNATLNTTGWNSNHYFIKLIGEDGSTRIFSLTKQ
jgi:uncharacterized delta-60 repeat protein